MSDSRYMEPKAKQRKTWPHGTFKNMHMPVVDLDSPVRNTMPPPTTVPFKHMPVVDKHMPVVVDKDMPVVDKNMPGSASDIPLFAETQVQETQPQLFASCPETQSQLYQLTAADFLKLGPAINEKVRSKSSHSTGTDKGVFKRIRRVCASQEELDEQGRVQAHLQREEIAHDARVKAGTTTSEATLKLYKTRQLPRCDQV